MIYSAEGATPLDDINPAALDLKVIGAFTSEGDYVGVALDLMIEVGSTIKK